MSDPIPNEPALFEIMRTHPVDAAFEAGPGARCADPQILEAGTCAANGGNMQSWRFLVISDPAIKQAVAASYKRAWTEIVGPRYRAGGPAPGSCRAFRSHARVGRAPGRTPARGAGVDRPVHGWSDADAKLRSSIYPAVQNMLLAARALGLGATLTTLYLQFEKDAEAAMGLPADVHSYALLPIGYPLGRFGPVRREALAEVVYEDRWGQAYRSA